jgi:hypothetical protein
MPTRSVHQPPYVQSRRGRRVHVRGSNHSVHSRAARSHSASTFPASRTFAYGVGGLGLVVWSLTEFFRLVTILVFFLLFLVFVVLSVSQRRRLRRRFSKLARDFWRPYRQRRRTRVQARAKLRQQHRAQVRRRRAALLQRRLTAHRSSSRPLVWASAASLAPRVVNVRSGKPAASASASAPRLSKSQVTMSGPLTFPTPAPPPSSAPPSASAAGTKGLRPGQQRTSVTPLGTRTTSVRFRSKSSTSGSKSSASAPKARPKSQEGA